MTKFYLTDTDSVDMMIAEVAFMSDNVSKLKYHMREISSYLMLVIGAVIAAFCY